VPPDIFVAAPTVTAASDVCPVPPFAADKAVLKVNEVAVADPRIGVIKVGDVLST
jgi:hypothetical protein